MVMIHEAHAVAGELAEMMCRKASGRSYCCLGLPDVQPHCTGVAMLPPPAIALGAVDDLRREARR